jgi:hypothetical protein
MQRIAVAYLLAVLALLPAVDVVYCPDGCGSATRSPSVCQTARTSTDDGCGFCLNAVAISQPPLYVPPVRRHQSVVSLIVPSFVASAPPALERPPRVA